MDMQAAIENDVGPAPWTGGADGALRSLAGNALASRFCGWRGASGRRYVASIYAVDRGAPRAGLPDFDGFVLIAATVDGTARRIVDVAAIARAADARQAVAAALEKGAAEWHVHFLAEDRQARATVAADLSSRHIPARRV